jgi:hypothetical protein
LTRVVGRKNHYGSKSQRGTDVASIFYTLLETAKLSDLNPAEYLVKAVLAARRGEVVFSARVAGDHAAFRVNTGQREHLRSFS